MMMGWGFPGSQTLLSQDLSHSHSPSALPIPSQPPPHGSHITSTMQLLCPDSSFYIFFFFFPIVALPRFSSHPEEPTEKSSGSGARLGWEQIRAWAGPNKPPKMRWLSWNVCQARTTPAAGGGGGRAAREGWLGGFGGSGGRFEPGLSSTKRVLLSGVWGLQLGNGGWKRALPPPEQGR